MCVSVSVSSASLSAILGVQVIWSKMPNFLVGSNIFEFEITQKHVSSSIFYVDLCF